MVEDCRQEGGEAACWADEVCPTCGRVRGDAGTTPCEECAEQTGEESRNAEAEPVQRADPSGGTSRRRDRDEEGRARNARPRDGLGRPLPYDSPGVERQPEGVERTPADSLAEAQRLLDTGMPFHAHEVLEDAWKGAPEVERALWRGLAQLAVGLTHAARGNVRGGQSLLRRGAENIESYRAEPPHGIDIGGLLDWAHGLADALPARHEPPEAPAVAPSLRR